MSVSSLAVLLAGPAALSFALDVRDATARWTGRFGAASGIVALALYGALQGGGRCGDFADDYTPLTRGRVRRGGAASRFASSFSGTEG